MMFFVKIVFVFLIIFISSFTFLVNVISQAKRVEIVITIEPNPIFDIFTEVDVVALIAKVSTVFDIVDIVICFLKLFLDLQVSSLRDELILEKWFRN